MVVRPVVAGLDGSEESLRAAAWAAEEAPRHRPPLRIVSGKGRNKYPAVLVRRGAPRGAPLPAEPYGNLRFGRAELVLR